MITRFLKLCVLLVVAGAIVPISAQVDSIVGQVSQSVAGSFAGGISGNGRFVVFESTGNLATVNPRNDDLNNEIFLYDYAQRRIFQITDTRSLLIETVRPATGSVTLSSGTSGSVDGITVGGVQIMSGAEDFATSLDQTATNVADNINNFTSTPDYTASADGAVITISAAITGTEANGLTIEATSTVITTATTNMSGGYDGTGPVLSTNTKVQVTNTRPVISNDGRWIAFSSNATTSVPGAPDATNPGDFDANDYTDGDGNNVLTGDGNMEIWMYQIPAVSDVDLSQGDDIPETDLTGGAFIQVTNTAASRLPVAGSATQTPLIASDNTDPSISDDGNAIAFVSNRDLIKNGNTAPEDNPEIFTFIRGSSTISQVTMTPRGGIGEPIANFTPTISGNGLRVMFSSNADNPIIGMKGGDNTDLNEEVFLADLDASGAPTGVNRQVTNTSPTNPGEIVNLVNFGRRLSRDGRFLAFDSYADITNENAGENQPGFATFLYDVDTDTFQRIGPRSDSDSAASGGDIARYPGFTDYDGSGVPHTLVLETRLNITPEGIVPENEEDGLNTNPLRPAQMYSYPITTAPAGTGTPIFTRLTKLPAPSFFLGTFQPLPSESLERIAFTVPQSEIGTGNPDLSPEVYYLLIPQVNVEPSNPNIDFFTGATSIPVGNDPVPDPSPAPSPTPQTPAAEQGISRGMLAKVTYSVRGILPNVNKTAVGGFDRRFNYPMELNGVTMSIGGVTVGLKSVAPGRIEFIAPLGLAQDIENPLPVVINNNGVVVRGDIVIVAYRPDIFRTDTQPELNRAKVFNVTNRVITGEPFTVATLPFKGGVKVATQLRLYLTGVEGLQGNAVSIRIGPTPVPATIGNAVPVEPGVYTVDFFLAPSLDMLGDQPITLTILNSSGAFQGRRQDDAPRVKIL